MVVEVGVASTLGADGFVEVMLLVVVGVVADDVAASAASAAAVGLGGSDAGVEGLDTSRGADAVEEAFLSFPLVLG